MAALDAEIDRLYQLPLADFTTARNALASRAGAAAASVKALEKPTLPGWVLNQLYWTERSTYDALVAAAARRRSVHARVIGGQTGDVAAADAEHRAAVRKAMAAAREILASSGAPATSATLHAVADGLESLPEAGRPGRWVRPAKPPGLEALAGLAAARRTPVVEAADAPERADAARRADQAAKREAEARRRDETQVEKETKAARAAERTAEAAFTRARQTLAEVEQERGRLESQLKFANKRALDLADEIRHAEHALGKASAARIRLERRLEALRKA